MPSHGHGASISSAGLVGTLGAYTWDHLASGIVSAQDVKGSVNPNGHYGYYRYTVNASHGHSVILSNTGGNNHHENRQPYTVVNRWRRTG